MEEVYQYLKDTVTYYLATMDGDQPRVRPFGTIHLFEGKLYMLTNKQKDVSKQISLNPKVELCATKSPSEWIRVCATLVNDDNIEAKRSILEAYPVLQKNYTPEGEDTQVLYLKDATATFSAFGKQPYTVKF